MSYANIGYAGLGDIPIPVAAPTSDQVAAEIKSNLPYASELEAEYNKYSAYLDQAKSLAELSPEDIANQAIDWGETTLKAYAAANGIPTSAAELRAVAAGKLDEFLQQNTGISIAQIQNLKNLDTALQGIVVAGATSALGVDPKLAAVTVEALADLKLDENDFRSIGSTAGAIAGAAICQSFGIPAPIGSFIGGTIGGFVGGQVGTFFCGGMSASEISAEIEKERAAAKAELSDIRVRVQALTDEQIVPAYYASWDDLLKKVDGAWAAREIRTGARFGLRWFGRSKSWYTTYQLNPSTTAPNFWVDTSKINPYAISIPSSSRRSCVSSSSGGEVCTTIYNYKCREAFGCPYPTFGSFGAGDLERAAQAMATYGAMWKAPKYRTRIVLPAPTQQEIQRTSDASSPADKKKYGTGPYTSRLVRQVQSLTNLAGPNAASMCVMGDLVRTAAYVNVERKILKEASTRNARLLAEHYKASTRANNFELAGNLLSGAVLVGGVGFLGYQAWKAYR